MPGVLKEVGGPKEERSFGEMKRFPSLSVHSFQPRVARNTLVQYK